MGVKHDGQESGGGWCIIRKVSLACDRDWAWELCRSEESEGE